MIMEDEQMNGANDHSITLSATIAGKKISIDCVGGDPAPSLARGSGAHHFTFTLQDSTGHNVQFASLDIRAAASLASLHGAIAPPTLARP